ncbi:MAG: hypothetical protein ACK448_05245 [Bacteroidota bacterium]
MKIVDWLNISAKHELTGDEELFSFGIFPDNETQRKLKNHRHLWNLERGKLTAKFFTHAINTELPEIDFLEPTVTFNFILATKDSNFQLITKNLDIPFFYENHRHEISIDGANSAPDEVAIVFANGNKYKPSPMQLPNGYQSIGNLILTIENQVDFFKNIVNLKRPLSLNFQFKSAAYPILIELIPDMNTGPLPEIVEDDNGYAHFSLQNVNNNTTIFALSTEPINLVSASKLSIQSYYISTDKEKKRIKHKNVRFSIDNLTNHPSYPQHPLLYKKVKL